MDYRVSNNFSIVQLEALNLVHAVKFLLPDTLRQFKICVNTDNSASQQLLENGKGKDSLLCACARELWLHYARYNFELEIAYKPGSQPVIADALSRSQSSLVNQQKASQLWSNLSLKQIVIPFSLTILDFTL